jgi:hypothetical protein
MLLLSWYIVMVKGQWFYLRKGYLKLTIDLCHRMSWYFCTMGNQGRNESLAFGAELCTMRTVCTADTVNCELLASFIQILTLWPIPHIWCLSGTFRRMNFAIEGLCILCLGALNESSMGHYRKALTLLQIIYLCLWCDLLSLLISEQRFSLSRTLTCVLVCLLIW